MSVGIFLQEEFYGKPVIVADREMVEMVRKTLYLSILSEHTPEVGFRYYLP